MTRRPSSSGSAVRARPVDECPFAQRFDQTVGHQELGGGDLAGIEPGLIEGVAQSQFVPCRKGHQLRSKFHDVLRGDAIKEHPINLVNNHGAGGF